MKRKPPHRGGERKEPSLTFSAAQKGLAFGFALYLCYKEVREWIREGTKADIQLAYMQKDIEANTKGIESLKAKITDAQSLRADFEAERSRNYTVQEQHTKDITTLQMALKDAIQKQPMPQQAKP